MIPYKRYFSAGRVSYVALLKRLVREFNQLQAQVFRFSKLVKKDVDELKKRLDELTGKEEILK